MKPLILAVDASISMTGMSILKHVKDDTYEIIKVGSFGSTAKDYPIKWERKEYMGEQFRTFLDKYINRIEFCVFENYSYGSAGHLADLGELNGLYKAHLFSNKIFIDSIPPATIKKVIAGKGRASKEEVRDALEKYVSNYKDIKFKNLDESDSVATGIAYSLKMMQEVLKLEED